MKNEFDVMTGMPKRVDMYAIEVDVPVLLKVVYVQDVHVFIFR